VGSSLRRGDRIKVGVLVATFTFQVVGPQDVCVGGTDTPAFLRVTG